MTKNNRQSNEKKNRRCYFLHICATILVFSNSFFLFWNINDWQIKVEESTILLSVIGFLFAFAAINIYSIFNTRVDKEKEDLNDLIDQYEKRLINDREQLSFITSIVRFQTRLHAISSTKRFNDHSQFIEWIDESLDQLDTFIDRLTVFHNDDDKETFYYLYSELQFVLRDAKPLIEAKKKDVEGDEFWKGRQIHDTKDDVINKMENIIIKIGDIEGYDFENQRPFSEQPSDEDETSLGRKLVDVITKTIKEHRSSRPKGKRK